MGDPTPDTISGYIQQSGLPDERSFREILGDEMTHVYGGEYRHPEGRSPFNPMNLPDNMGTVPYVAPGVFAECVDVDEIEAFAWPQHDYLDFSDNIERLHQSGDVYRAGGVWSPFFHMVSDLFGMEELFIKMHTDPEVVDAAIRRTCDYYLAANARFFAEAGDLLDGYFFGNDFGTQRDLLISPAQFDRFFLPWYKKFADQAHACGYQVLYHSCGAVHKLIDRFIDAGIDVLNPLQALASDMDAETIARDFKGRIAFLGGIDVQQLLIHGTEDDIIAEVHRVMELLGPHLVVSPSHPNLQPDVPFNNIRMMAEAVGCR